MRPHRLSLVIVVQLLGCGDDAAVAPSSSDDTGPPGDAAPGLPEDDLRSAYLDLVRTIDPSAGDEALDRLWQAAGGDDAARAVRVGELLWRTVTGGPAAAAGEPGGVEALAASIAEHGTRGTLISLAGDGSAALAARARSDPAVLDALASLDAYTFAEYDHLFAQAGFARSEFHALPPTTQQAVVSYK